MLFSASYLSSKTMSLILLKSKETLDLTKYSVRIVLCSSAMGGFGCNVIYVGISFDCSVTAFIIACVAFLFAHETID